MIKMTTQEYNEMLGELYNTFNASQNTLHIKIKYGTLSTIKKNAINDFITNLLEQGWIIHIDQYTDVIEEPHNKKEIRYIIITGTKKSKL